MPGNRLNRNSDVSMQQRFKYAVSKKSHRSKPSKINWMPQSDVRLAVADENESIVIKIEIVKPNLAFTLTKNNICGLETGKIIAPGSISSCWRSKQQSSPYLLIVYVDKGFSQMILLLNYDSDDDEVTKRWKWKIQTHLGFAKSWPNLDIVHEIGAQSGPTDRVTLMLGKEWLAFFKYVRDSLPIYWKRFEINKISDLKLHVHQTIPGKNICVIAFQEKGDLEVYSIISGRSQEIYNYIESYKNNKHDMNIRELPITGFHEVTYSGSSVSPQTSVSYGQTSNSSDRTYEVQLYPVDVHDLVTRQKRFYAVEDIYIHPPKVHPCPQNVPNWPVDNLPAPLPCGSHSRIKDMGYIDRHYFLMDKPNSSKTSSVAIPMPQEPNVYDPQKILELKMDYLTLPCWDENQTSEKVVTMKEETNFFDPFHIVQKQSCTWCFPVYHVIPSSYPARKSFVPMDTIDSLEFTPEDDNIMLSLKEDIPTSHGNLSHDVKFEENLDLRFDFSSALKNTHTETISNVYNPNPPSPCRTFKRSCSVGWGTHSATNLYKSRSDSAVDSSSIKQSTYYSTVVRRKLNQWAPNCTLPRDTEEFIKDYHSEVNQLDLLNGNDDYTYYSVSSEGESDDENFRAAIHIDNYDLNMLTFPINNLNKKEKEDVFLWMNNILTSQQNDQSKETSKEQNISVSENVSTQCEENGAYRHNVRMRRSISQTDINERRTSSMIYGYWSASKICRTLDKVLRNKPPLPDTLQISIPVRKTLCLRLYTTESGTGKHDWEALAGFIGLTADCVSVIELCIRNHALKYTAAEIVLRHWQSIYNKYWKKDRLKCPEPCTKERLVYLLDQKLQRQDLVELLQNDGIQPNDNICMRQKQSNDHSKLTLERFSSYTIDDDLFGNDSLTNNVDPDTIPKLMNEDAEEIYSGSTTNLKKSELDTDLKGTYANRGVHSVKTIEKSHSLSGSISQRQENSIDSGSTTHLKKGEFDVDIKKTCEETYSVVTVKKSHSLTENIGQSQTNSIRRIETYNLNGKNVLLNEEHRKSYV